MDSQTLSERVSILTRTVGGDIELIPDVAAWPNHALVEASNAAQLVLKHDAVARVLRGYASGDLARDDVQAWASFVRWGIVQDAHGGPVTAVDIEFEDRYEDPIVETLARLDELGDVIDGELRNGEAEELLAALGASRTAAP